MGQEEEPSPAVASADFSRREQARRNVVAQALKVCADFGKAQIEVAFDVFAEHPLGIDLVDNAGDIGPEMSGVGNAAAPAGHTERLAWVTGSDDMNAAAPRAAVEGSQIVPDRRRSQGLVRHPRHESGRGMTFPLDVTYSSKSGFGDMEAEIESGVSCAEGEPVQVGSAFSAGMGTNIHKCLILRVARRRSEGGSQASDY